MDTIYEKLNTFSTCSDVGIPDNAEITFDNPKQVNFKLKGTKVPTPHIIDKMINFTKTCKKLAITHQHALTGKMCLQLPNYFRKDIVYRLRIQIKSHQEYFLNITFSEFSLQSRFEHMVLSIQNSELQTLRQQ